MRNRNCSFLIRLTKKEMDTVTKKARKLGLSREGYCRQALLNPVVKEAPSADAQALTNELKRVGNNLNQVLALAHSKGFLDVPRLKQVIEETWTAEKAIIQAYCGDK